MQTPSTLQKETRINGCFIPFLALDFACAAAAVVAALPVDQQSTWCAVISAFSMVTLLLCCCVRCIYSRVCVRTLREGCRHDGPLSPYVHAVEPCVPLLFASPFSICVLVLRQGCVWCVPAAVDWSVCRAWCAAYGACLAAALSSFVCLPSVCVCRTSRLPCCSPCPSLCRSAPHHRTTTLTMTTCRLLCALFLLALCCCPSVCVTATGEDQDANSPSLSRALPQVAGVPGPANTSTTSSSTGMTDALARPQNPDGKGQASDTRTDTARGTGGVADTLGNSDPTSPASDIEQGKGGSGRSGSSGTAADTVQKNGDNGATESKSGNNPSTDQTNTIADDSAEKTTATTTTTTTTTTTKAPSTTTTATAAPEASSTTTTEAPTTTTTRAPSRLREIDGSLSSSAWVCAPLLLAVSALAYTTLG
ncbi:putative trans-sialidase [Trypanosoma cruzi]|uniref:Putative trans-sialidase n=1 Tax=Trypanosoma cruzi TaxID=5693 RepID=A0A7J6Y6V0_TRYCR|nr:putative trans-sialidase [Trypanosoma cruzi]